MYRYPDYLEFFHRKMTETGEKYKFQKNLYVTEMSNAQCGQVA